MIILVYFVIKQGNAEKGLLLVWSLVVLAAALGQRRFAYYYAINVALLTSYLSVLLYYILRLIIDYLRGARTDYMSWRVLELPDFNELVAQLTRASARAERKRASKTGRVKVTAEPGSHITITTTVATIAIVFFVVFFPNINLAIDAASQARFAPSDAWMSSLDWLEENTPEPFGDPDAYYALHETPPPGESYQYPDSAYGVLAWWDYGYWITRIAHRIPNANPSQDPDAITSVASFFTAQDEETANEIARELETSYVIIDFETATGKFHAVATWAGKDKADFFDVYLVPEEENRLTPRLLYYPEYYRSVSTRLYNFNGSEVVPETTLVISYEERADEAGTSYRVITDVRQFTSYEEAETFRSDQESANYRIIGVDPFTSPVPLEALEHYRLANSSDNSVAISANMTVPAVKIFEYLD